MATFDVWATLLTKKSVDGLVSRLINKGCVVAGLSKDGNIGVMGETACLAALSVRHDDVLGKEGRTQMLEMVRACLDEMDVHYYSIVVRQDTGATWSGEAPGDRQD